jgi:hypothetical protein
MKDYRSCFRLASAAMAALSMAALQVGDDRLTLQREQMVSEQLEGRGIRMPDVLRAMRASKESLRSYPQSPGDSQGSPFTDSTSASGGSAPLLSWHSVSL